jgi:VanZ family protein
VRRLLLVVVLLIVYVSLYPFHFNRQLSLDGPVWTLLHSWPDRFGRGDLRDGASNVLLYLPLGYVAVLVFRRRWWAALLLGATLSTSIELAQAYDQGRFSSLFDVLCNTLGTAAGVVAGLALPAVNLSWTRLRQWRSGVVALAGCWLAYQLYPFVPTLTRSQWQHSGMGLLRTPLSPVETLAGTAEWFAFAAVLEWILGRLPARWLAIAMLALPARLFIIDRATNPAEVLGAGLALLLWNLAAEKRALVAPILLAAAIVLRELVPLQFLPHPQPFSWVPFATTIDADRLPGVTVILRKAFEYGAMVWLMRRIGMVRAGLLVAAALFALEWTQRWLPGRSPEITDPVMALLMMLLLLWDRRR